MDSQMMPVQINFIKADKHTKIPIPEVVAVQIQQLMNIFDIESSEVICTLHIFSRCSFPNGLLKL